MKNYNELIGKYLVASGWHYDNGGSCEGVIKEIKKHDYDDKIEVHVESESIYGMKSFTFCESEILTLIKDGCLPKANRLLNSGTNAKII